MQLWFLILDNHYSIEMVTNPRKWFARQPLDGPGSQYFWKPVMGDREISTFQLKWVTCRYFKPHSVRITQFESSIRARIDGIVPQKCDSISRFTADRWHTFEEMYYERKRNGETLVTLTWISYHAGKKISRMVSIWRVGTDWFTCGLIRSCGLNSPEPYARISFINPIYSSAF